LRALGCYERVERRLRCMDAGLSAGEYVALVAALWVGAPVLAWGLGYPLWVAALALGVAMAVPQLIYVASLGWRRKRFGGQLPNALDLIASSLRVGHGLQRALQTVAAEASDPLASEFRRALTEIALGAGV